MQVQPKTEKTDSSNRARHLKPLFQSENASFYQADFPNAPQGFETYVVSTPESAKMLSDPFVIGQDYRNALGSAVTAALSRPQIQKHLEKLSDSQINVLHFLRGGLSYQVLEALAKTGRPFAKGSFMSSERKAVPSKTEPNCTEWKIHKDQYIELNLEPNTALFIGDITASGSTIKSGLAKILERFGDSKAASVKQIVFFTTGGFITEEIMLDFHEKFKKTFPNYERTQLVFTEGIFHVADSQNPVHNKTPGTDLVAWNAVLAPEFEELLRQNPLIGLEACMIYDGGSRSFDFSKHFDCALKYAHEVRESLEKGINAFDLISDRWSGASLLSENARKKLSEPKTGLDWVKTREEKIRQLTKND
ncbi:MAG: hypothetical protein V1777_02105 [Candidatus Micrarchaeota archaeon]